MVNGNFEKLQLSLNFGGEVYDATAPLAFDMVRSSNVKRCENIVFVIFKHKCKQYGMFQI